MNQESAPIAEALEKFLERRVVPFDVPGHKRGKGNPDLTNFLGSRCMMLDVNSMKPLDNLCHPVSVIRLAEKIAAEAFGSCCAFFMVGGTTSAVQSMIFSAAGHGDKIILPRNVHRSVINALILSGAEPVYVNPDLDQTFGISLGMKVESVREAVRANPDAKAILVNNPTYYGVCSNIKELVKIAHENKMLLLADEAHGTHFYFGEDGKLPVSAIAAGADIAAVSMHKSGGSLTQSSFLLAGTGVEEAHIRQMINLTQTTSGSYLLLSSLDLSRKKLALEGKHIFSRVIKLAAYARQEINQIGDYHAYSREIINGDSVFDFDVTKLSINTLKTGLAGIEVYDLLRDDYDIQVEFGDLGNILAYVSVGDRERDLERLCGALSEIRRQFRKSQAGMIDHEYINPVVAATPQKAFYSRKVSKPIEQAVGGISGEFVMCYPPGIPILAPGELISKEIIDYIEYAKNKGCQMTGAEDAEINYLKIIED